VSTAPTPLHPSPAEGQHVPAGEGLGLVALLELLAAPGDGLGGSAVGGTAGSARGRLVRALRGWSRRAAAWGAGPQGSRRAW
jgi:hypothetical protein